MRDKDWYWWLIKKTEVQQVLADAKGLSVSGERLHVIADRGRKATKSEVNLALALARRAGINLSR